jgi:hypothetical protein
VSEETVAEYRGRVIIEWPPAPGPGAFLGCLVSLYDADSGKPVTACSHADITLHADAAGLVTADLTLFADANGEPILDAGTMVNPMEIRTGVFPFLVAEMRVRPAGGAEDGEPAAVQLEFRHPPGDTATA